MKGTSNESAFKEELDDSASFPRSVQLSKEIEQSLARAQYTKNKCIPCTSILQMATMYLPPLLLFSFAFQTVVLISVQVLDSLGRARFEGKFGRGASSSQWGGCFVGWEVMCGRWIGLGWIIIVSG
jgi:hypothetical protein